MLIMSEVNASVPPAVAKASPVTAAVIVPIDAPLIAILTIVEPRLNAAVPVTTLSIPALQTKAIIATHSKGLGAAQTGGVYAKIKLNSITLFLKLLHFNY